MGKKNKKKKQRQKERQRARQQAQNRSPSPAHAKPKKAKSQRYMGREASAHAVRAVAKEFFGGSGYYCIGDAKKDK